MPLQTGYKKEQFESTGKCHVFLMFCILLYISRVYHIIDCQSAPPGVAFDASRTNARHWSCLDTRAGQRLATPDQQLADLTCDLYAKGKTCPHGTLCRLSRYGYWVVWLSFSFLWVGSDQIANAVSIKTWVLLLAVQLCNILLYMETIKLPLRVAAK